MCTQKPPNNWSEQLYNYYCEAVKEYLSARILPRIKEKHDESMLRELVRRWENHKLLVRFLSHVFKYLDRFYVKRLSLHELAEVGSQAFHDIVFNAMKRDVRAAILELIRREREGEMVDRKLIKQVVEELCREYSSMLASEDRRKQSIVVEGCESRLPAATAIPLSLIVNELITNAAKHGQGKITVRFEEIPEGGHLLSVCNDGAALPEGFDPAASKGLGMQIVQALVGQIGGKLRIDSCPHQGGARFAVTFA